MPASGPMVDSRAYADPNECLPETHKLTAHFHLQAEALSCERGERLLFQGLDLSVRPGEIWLVEGANGSGKTTLLRILCGLRQPDDGGVRWNGTPVEEIRAEYHAGIAYLGHHSGIKQDLTAHENLRFARALCAGRPDIDAALARVGLGSIDDLPVSGFSAGQRRRLAMARLLLSRARVWLLDEPFTALDPAGRSLVRDLLAEHAAGGGAAVLATHHEIAVRDADMRRLRLGAETEADPA